MAGGRTQRGSHAWRLRTRWLVALAACALPSVARAEIELPVLFQDGMVLQRDAPLPIWGRAKPGEAVTVVLAGRELAATADDEGNWSVRHEPLPAGGPHQLTIRGTNEVVIDDVLVGEVWIGSGQSNMRMTVEYSDGFEAMRARADLPRIRMMREQSLHATVPQWHGSGEWVVCTPETVGNFSAALFYFGLRIHEETDVPVGLIDASIGGTAIQFWTSLEAQYAVPELNPFATALQRQYESFDIFAGFRKHRTERLAWKEACKVAEREGRKLPQRPWNEAEIRVRIGELGGLFYGKIAPLIPYAIRGAVWYQGEANELDAPFYHWQLPAMVRDWRARWGQGDFPFAWVQLPNYIQPPRRNADWPMIREAMRRSLCEPNTGMAITIDCGDPDDLHPSNKRDFGERLAAWALVEVYELEGASSGPLYQGHTIQDGWVTLFFTHTDGGLHARGELEGFEVADAEGRWHVARACIHGDRVCVRAPGLEDPREVRYAWSENPRAALFNGAGLPASPFSSLELDALIAEAHHSPWVRRYLR